jgi:MATE family multidrug resistance protein
MNNLDSITARDGAAAWRAEFSATIALAIPIALTQLGQVAMMTSDLALIGRLGDVAVGAAALGHVVLYAGFMICLGLANAVAPLASQAVGARNPDAARQALHVGLWVVTAVAIPLTAVQLHGYEILLAMGQPHDVAQLAGRYLTGLSWSMAPACWFIALRNFMSSLDRPQPGLWITLAAIPANTALAYVLIHGSFGLPKLDMLGAGTATTIVNLGMCIAAGWVCVARAPFREYRLLNGLWRPDRRLTKKLLIIGLPISGAFLLEYSLFGIAAVMMGWISTTAMVGHQIALQVAAIVFMVPLGIGLAATVRVGHAAGRRDADGARRSGFAAIALGVAFMSAMAFLVAVFRNEIPLLFLGEDADADTVSLAARLLILGATFFIADGVQTIAAGGLRGINDTRIPLLFSAASFWLVGFVIAYALAFTLGRGAEGVWIGLSAGVFTYAVLLIWRMTILLRRPGLPDVIPAPAE